MCEPHPGLAQCPPRRPALTAWPGYSGIPVPHPTLNFKSKGASLLAPTLHATCAQTLEE